MLACIRSKKANHFLQELGHIILAEYKEGIDQ